jgi:hypothetical protein
VDRKVYRDKFRGSRDYWDEIGEQRTEALDEWAGGEPGQSSAHTARVNAWCCDWAAGRREALGDAEQMFLSAGGDDGGGGGGLEGRVHVRRGS